MSVSTKKWCVRPGYAFTAGAGLGGGLFVFEFLNIDENVIHAMAFLGLGIAGSPGSGTATAAKEVIKKLATTVLGKAAGAGYGVATDTSPGYKDQRWTILYPNKAFSADDLSGSSGRVTILSVSVAKVGMCNAFISASDGIVSLQPLFGGVSVDVQPQNFDLAIGVVLGFWWEAFSVQGPVTGDF